MLFYSLCLDYTVNDLVNDIPLFLHRVKYCIKVITAVSCPSAPGILLDQAKTEKKLYGGGRPIDIGTALLLCYFAQSHRVWCPPDIREYFAGVVIERSVFDQV